MPESAKAARTLAVGVSNLGFADPGDGVAGSVFTQCPIIEKGTVAFNFNDPTSVDFWSEGMDSPWESYDKLGEADSFEFGIPSPTVDELVAFKGGKKSGDKWEAPIELPNIRKSFKLATKPYKNKQVEYVFANCKVFAKFNRAPSGENTDLLLVRCTILTPVSAAGVVGSPYSRESKDVSPAL